MAPIQSREMRRHTDEVNTVAFSPCGNFGYSGGKDNRLVLWDMRTGDVVSERTDVHTKMVQRMAVAASGAFIVTCDCYDNRVMVWHAKTLAPMQTLEGHEGGVDGVAVSPDSTMIVSGDDGGVVKVWEVQGEGGRWKVKRTINDHTGPVFAVAFSPDGKMLATGSDDTTIKVYDVTNDFSLMHTLEGHTDWILSLSFSPDSTRLCSGSKDNTIKVWNPLEGTLVNDHATTSAKQVAYSPNGNLLASHDNDKNINIWQPETMELLHTYDMPSIVKSISWSPTGPFLLSGHRDNSVRLPKVALLETFYRRENRNLVLLASLRFTKSVHNAPGTEQQKVDATKAAYPKKMIECGSCGARREKLLTCSACKSAHYCNAKCQADNWKSHKVECKRIRKANKKPITTKDFGLIELDVLKFLLLVMEGGGAAGVGSAILAFV